MIKHLMFLLAVACCLTGCMNVNYEPINESRSLTPTSPQAVKVFNSPGKVKKQYQTIGYCIVSGNYRDYSRDDIVKRLQKEAAQVGADGVVISTYSVVPADSERLRQLTDMQNMRADVFTAGNGSGGSGWDRLSANFDSGYGSIAERKAVRTYNYRRVIRAKFITFKDLKLQPVKTIAVRVKVDKKKNVPEKK